MQRIHIVGIVFVLAIFAIIIGTAVYTGAGPAPGGGSSDTITDFPTATPPEGGTDNGGSSSTGEAKTAPFSLTVTTVEECGTTCRDVTAVLQNNQNDTATGVTVFIRIFAGEANTDTKDLVWEGKEPIGTLSPGASHSTTKRVDLSLQEARKIDQRDGWITILTSVKTDERTVTFSDSEQVT